MAGAMPLNWLFDPCEFYNFYKNNFTNYCFDAIVAATGTIDAER
jgi:hypothetical protein